MTETSDRLARSLRPGLNAHRQVADIAISMANELFEIYAAENDVYRKMKEAGLTTEKKARRHFVKQTAPKLLEDARTQLTQLLGQPDDVISPHMKEEIYEALIADNALRANRLVAKEKASVPKRLH